MYKSLLVPVEFEHPDVGEAALRAAMSLADAGAVVTLLHIVAEIPAYAASYLPEGTLEKRREEAHAELSKISAAAGAAGVKEVVLTAGRPSTAILAEAASIKADCIVIASHHPGLQDYFLGSTATRVVSHADCSVLVIR